MIKRIQIMGLYGSGTNILERLCRDNFDAPTTQDYVEKHGNRRTLRLDKINKDREEVLFLLITKNPFAWVCSMRDTTHNHMPYNLPISTALTHKWVDGDYAFDNILDLRNHANKTYREVEGAAKHFHVVHHVDIVKDPVCVIQKISEENNLPLKGIIPDVSSATLYKGHVGTFARRQYYLNEEYVDRLSDEDMKCIYTNLNFDLEF